MKVRALGDWQAAACEVMCWPFFYVHHQLMDIMLLVTRVDFSHLGTQTWARLHVSVAVSVLCRHGV